MMNYFTNLRVRYADTDQMKVVYNGKYFEYFEVGRTEMMREIGLPYKTIEENGYVMPLVESHIKFKNSALYDDLLEIETRVEKLPLARVHIDYIIRNRERSLIIVEGFTDLVFLKKETNKITRTPEFFINKVKPLFNK